MIIEIVLLVIAIYLLCGLVFAIPFITKGVTVIDEGTHGSSLGFRIIILPGVIVFWPFLLKKWITAKSASHDEAA
ncbi:MAG: hypothetical protein ABUT20_24150 [Bacteroidota bacterium]